jgi:DNA-binding IclR family transcriptional regulator
MIRPTVKPDETTLHAGTRATRPASASVSSTALKALHVLESVAAEGRPLSLGEVSHRAGLDKSAAHRMLATLVHAGYVHQDPETRRYAMGYRVVSLSRNLLAENEVVRLARQTLERIAAETREGVHLEVLDGTETVLVQHVKGTQLVAVDFQVGDRSALHSTSIGKVLLAFQDADVIDAVIAAGLPALTASTITEPAALRRELRSIREQGYAIDDRETNDNMRCISVPVFERDRPLRMGISCSGPDSRYTLAYLDRLREPLLAASRDLSEKLGGAPRRSRSSA